MGIGLFRTEFCFLDQPEEPTVEAHSGGLPGCPRGLPRQEGRGAHRRRADKPLPFLTDAIEANLAPGVSAYRTTRRDPEVLDHQLEALAKAEAATEAKVWVMAPMTSTAEALRPSRRRPAPTA